MYSYNNNLLPPSFSNFFLRTNQVHSYNTRGSTGNQFYIQFCRTNIRKFSIIYQGFFNTLCCDIRNALSTHSFQSKIKSYHLSFY